MGGVSHRGGADQRSGGADQKSLRQLGHQREEKAEKDEEKHRPAADIGDREGKRKTEKDEEEAEKDEEKKRPAADIGDQEGNRKTEATVVAAAPFHVPKHLNWAIPAALKGGRSGYIYAVTSKHLTDGGTRDERASSIWSLKIPLKVKVFCWLLLRRRLLTRDRLLKRGWIEDPTCVLCGEEEESVDHLFAQCVFCKFILVTGANDIHTRDLGDDVNLVWNRWRDRKVRQVKQVK